MELALCLGDNTNKFSFFEKPSKIYNNSSSSSTSDKDLEFCMGLNVVFFGDRSLSSSSSPSLEDEKKKKVAARVKDSDGFRVSSSVNPSLQLHFPWFLENSEQGGRMLSGVATAEEEEVVPSMSESPPDSNDDENGTTRKKLRLSKDQSDFLEDSFKEHNTLNPKQKITLAKKMNLRPRQVEVWFQNRRARTKLKQTEVDYEYLKKNCESLTEDNRRLQKEVKELRALNKTSPFYKQLPATTLTMCPSCQRIATSAHPPSTSATNNLGFSTSSLHIPLIPVKPRPAKQVS